MLTAAESEVPVIVRTACLLCILAAVPPAWGADPSFINLGIGATDILVPRERSAADFRLEYRSGLSLLPFAEQYAKVKPWAGVEVTSRAALWLGGGLWLDMPIGTHFVLSPSAGFGYYDDNRGKNLGSTAEFRSQMEAGYVFDDATRLVASFSHTSNAGIGRHNPGTEAALLSIQIPLQTLQGF